LAERWAEFLTATAIPAYEEWRGQSSLQRGIFIADARNSLRAVRECRFHGAGVGFARKWLRGLRAED